MPTNDELNERLKKLEDTASSLTKFAWCFIGISGTLFGLFGWENWHSIPAAIDQKLTEKGIQSTLETVEQDAKKAHAVLDMLQHEKTFYFPFDWNIGNETGIRDRRISFPLTFPVPPKVVVTLNTLVSKPDNDKKGSGVAVEVDSIDSTGCTLHVKGETSTFAASGILIVVGTPKGP